MKIPALFINHPSQTFLIKYKNFNKNSIMEKEMDTVSELELMGISEAEVAAIKKEAKKLEEETEGVEVVYPIIVKGNSRTDAKEHYIGYFRQPNFKIFSKYITASTQNQVGAMRQLARDCFLQGDKELVEKDSLFLFGLMGQLSKVIEMRQGALVNL